MAPTGRPALLKKDWQTAAAACNCVKGNVSAHGQPRASVPTSALCTSTTSMEDSGSGIQVARRSDCRCICIARGRIRVRQKTEREGGPLNDTVFASRSI